MLHIFVPAISFTYSAHSLPLIPAFCGDTSHNLVGITVPSGTDSNSCHFSEYPENTLFKSTSGVSVPNVSCGESVLPVVGLNQVVLVLQSSFTVSCFKKSLAFGCIALYSSSL